MTGKQSPIIRPIGPDDFDVWSKLWTGYLTYYEASVPPDVYATSFERILSSEAHTFQGHLAEVGGTAVGLVHYVFHAHMWRSEPVCYLQDLFTTPAARGHGVGKALIQSVYAEADKQGAPKVYWLTQEFNYRGRMLYDQVGVKTPFIRYDRPS